VCQKTEARSQRKRAGSGEGRVLWLLCGCGVVLAASPPCGFAAAGSRLEAQHHDSVIGLAHLGRQFDRCTVSGSRLPLPLPA
jgi:hypothetical protein